MSSYNNTNKFKENFNSASQLDVHGIRDVKPRSLHKGYHKIFPPRLIFSTPVLNWGFGEWPDCTLRTYKVQKQNVPNKRDG